jgi:hypothetical protein
LRPGPEFEILGSVVIAHSVDVMDGLTVDQITPKQIFGDENVFEDVRRSASSGVSW